MMSTSEDGTILLSIFLRHHQTMALHEIQEKLEANGFWTTFPPEGIEVETWYVMMGIGQVVTLRVPAERLREVNRAIELSAWGAFGTEFYATYDFRPIFEEQRDKHRG